MFFFFITIIISYFLVYVSPSLLPTLENDSLTYIRNESIRLAFYPSIIDFFEEDIPKIINFQIFIFSLSISSIIAALRSQRVNNAFILIFYTASMTNIYYTSLSKTVLTESLFISCINILLALIIFYKDSNFKSILSPLIGFTIGCIISLRHEGIIIALALLFIFLFFAFKKGKKQIISCFLALFIIPSYESYYFYKYNEDRDSVIDKSLTGKIFMLSGFKDFEEKNLDSSNKELLNIYSESSKKIHYFLNKIKNPFLRNNLYSDYEVVAQYQINKIIKNDKTDIIEISEELKEEIFLTMIKKFPFNYIKLSFYHYLATWMPGGKQIFFDEYINESNLDPPFFNLLIDSSGKINSFNDLFKLIGLIYFQILMILSISLFIFVIYNKLSKKYILNLFINSFPIIAQLHLSSVCFINIGSPRYLMPVYSLLILSLVFFADRVLKKIK